MTSTSDQFLKSKDLKNVRKITFCISKLFIQNNTGSCCVDITVAVNINICICVCVCVCVFVCVCVSFCWLLCVLWVFVWVYVLLNQGASKNHQRTRKKKQPCHRCQTFNKPDAMLHETHSKALLVLMYQCSRSLGPQYH